MCELGVSGVFCSTDEFWKCITTTCMILLLCIFGLLFMLSSLCVYFD